MKRIEHIFIEKKVRNATWLYTLQKDGKFGIYMNGKLQRLFRDADEARTFFEIYTNK